MIATDREKGNKAIGRSLLKERQNESEPYLEDISQSPFSLSEA
tara:strand:- start:888 stop:1016 length:129 start_codon:yes stop_codon:yes gene_type:complete